MDDLLSAALSEAGLDEFFVSSNDCNSNDVSNTVIASDASDVGTSPETHLVPEGPSQSSSPTQLAPSTSLAEQTEQHHPHQLQETTTTTPPKLIRQVQGTAPDRGGLSTTGGGGTVPRRIIHPSQVQRRSVEHGGFTTGHAIRRTIQTPSGPQTQILRPFTNEQGHTVYRQVRTVSSASVNGQRILRGGQPVTTVRRGTPQNRVVVVRQETPDGPKYVRQIISNAAPGATPRGAVIRRIITRGGSSTAGRPVPQQYRPQTSHDQVHLETGHQYISNGQRPVNVRGGVVRGPSTYGSRQIVRGTPVYRSVANNGHPMRTGPPSRPGSSAGYSPAPSPSLGRKTPLSGIGGSSPALSAMPEFEYHNTSFMPSRNSENYLDQMANGKPRTPHELALMNSRRMGSTPSTPTTTTAPPRAFAGSDPKFDEVDTKPLLKPKQPEEKPSAPTTKSQKAKEEMKSALQSAKDKRIDDDEEENLGYAETYSEYRPAKLRSGLAHPDSVVETATLSSVAPPDVKYQCSIPEHLIDTGAVSALQLEAVIYACQAHEKRLPSGERCGYLIGDGAGVGKGRTVACIIFENYQLGRKRSIWLSVSSDLRFDSERDLRDIGAGRIKVYPLNKLRYAKISGSENGNIKKGCIFATYSSLIGECRTASKKYRSRLNQLVQWFGVDYDGVIIFDECHRAKNLCPGTGGKSTKTGKLVLELQKKLPNARIVYASATGATEPRNMAYMTRIGLWGEGQAFPEFPQFINAVERRGVGAMEIVAMDMKQRGLYLARQLSFRGVTFRVEEVALSDDFIKVYDESVKLWMECRRQFQSVLSTMSDAERSGCKQIWGQFWASHQRFFKYLCIGAKVEACVRMTREAIKTNKCIVIGLQSTGESRTNEVLEECGGELSEFVSTAKAVLQGLIEKHFPTERGACVDVFRDFDRMFEDGDRPKKRKKANPYGFDVLEELGLSAGPQIKGGSVAKRARLENGASEESDSEEDSDDEDEDDEDEEDDEGSDGDSDDSETEVKLGEKDEDWVNAILAEAASSSESEKEEEEDDSEEEEKPENENEGTASEEEFNPFTCDFSKGDPWAARYSSEDPKKGGKKKKREKTEEELEEERRQRRIRRKKKKRKLLKEQRKKERKQQKRELQSQAMLSTANEFISSSRLIDGFDINPQIIKAELLAAVERLGPSLPANTLDQLIDELGGPEFVAEMTGRKGRVVTRPDGEVEYELRSAGADVPLELMNMDEKDKFMKGDKLVAVISEAASSGISLQSDRRAVNQRRRVHITLELPWSADKAIQQFGRTHRSNQVSAPEYVFLISELAGEKRFASIVAKRLESLGALTHGDRRATESRDLSQFNMDTKYGRNALDVLLRSVVGTLNPPLIPPPADYKPGDFFSDMRLYMEGVGLLSRMDNGQYAIEREGAVIAKFLNRILGLPVHAQNALFQYFTEIVNELIAQAKHDGTFDMGIMDLGTGGDQVQKLETRVFLGRQEKGSYRVEIHKIGVERGVSWEDAHAIFSEHNVGEDGFYVSNPPNGGRQIVALVYGIGKKRLDTGDRLYALTRPSTGRSPKMETFSELSKRFHKVTPDEAKIVWEAQYDGASKMCQHSYVHGRCKNEANGTYCEVGRRTRTYFVLSGSVLSVWPVVEEVLNGNDHRGSRIQVIRVRTDQDQKIVGLLVLPHYVRQLVLRLEEHAGRSYVENKKPSTAAPSPS